MLINGMSESLAGSLLVLVFIAFMSIPFYWLLAIRMRTPGEIAADEQRKLERKAKKMAV
jgi:ABC-type glycerol-3-phosphate transport system permease component